MAALRKTKYRGLGDGQRQVLMLGTEGPVTRETLTSQGLKAALHSVKRLRLMDAQGHTTETGITALRDGRYPLEADPLHGAFEQNVITLMHHWRVKRPVAIRRAVAQVAKAIADEEKGES